MKRACVGVSSHPARAVLLPWPQLKCSAKAWADEVVLSSQHRCKWGTDDGLDRLNEAADNLRTDLAPEAPLFILERTAGLNRMPDAY